MSDSPFHHFEQRKSQHIQIALKSENQAIGFSGFDSIHLPHNALPDIDFQDISLKTTLLGKDRLTPFYISGMTAGHPKGIHLNKVLAEACEKKGWILGVGSQRRQLSDPIADKEWSDIKKQFPNVDLLGNIGLTQVIPLVKKKQTSKLLHLVENLKAKALVVHTNPLQEVLQPEGTPYFKDGFRSLEVLCRQMPIPVILKETGCGFSKATLKRLNSINLTAVDVSGLGGTHWGRVEGQRHNKDSIFYKASQTFALWGIPTVESLYHAGSIQTDYAIWASGGVRSGLDAAKAMALSAQAVGFAWPALKIAMQGDVDAVVDWMSGVEYEFKVALFCLGLTNVKDINHLGRQLS